MPSAHAASDLHDAGLRIQYAAFDEDGAVKLSGAEKSVQGNAWQAASAEGWVPPAGLTQDLDGLWKKAEVRHADACSTCHGAPKASAHTANEWAGQLPKRGGRTGHSSAGANELMFKSPSPCNTSPPSTSEQPSGQQAFTLRPTVNKEKAT